MARSRSRSPRLTIARSAACGRVCSPSLGCITSSFDGVENDQEDEFLRKEVVEEEEEAISKEAVGSGGNKVMVVVDSSVEAKWALEWALSHAVQAHDIIVFLHVCKSTKNVSRGMRSARVYDLLRSMKNMCQKRSPGVQVEVMMVEGEEKGPAIVEAAKQLKVSLLVLGQRKRRRMWRLLKRWAWKGGLGGGCSSHLVDYCIQNASCMTFSVRRMSKELGGYLITTKHHKNFWLLA
ncbi:hypothetical protein SLEP1_g34660 [Rubroshorea leprosula]|uniref:UspA domain-containing protein n=1 Tax=Rubroshorea leprosula TaxID=152421 RepID=A0AAV5KKX8_9ROSI|nr:hypothetical protein SLEP1_g34660 [Rubroshorea leprosula]